MSKIIQQKTRIRSYGVFLSVVDVARHLGIPPEPLRIVRHDDLDLLAIVDPDGCEIAYKGVNGALWGLI